MCVSSLKSVSDIRIPQFYRMTKSDIKEIIESYIKEETPKEVHETFERWFLDNESREQKDAALQSVWDNLSLIDADAPEDPYVILADAERIEAAASMDVIRRKNRWLWTLSVIAACLAVFAVVGWRLATGSVTCLASSETSKAVFTLPDGSRICLNRNSRLTYSTGLNGRCRNVKLDGEGYFDVASDPDHPFHVEAAGLSIKVLGTIFTVSAYEDKPVRAFLEEGSIEASVRGYDDILLTPDHAVVYDSNSGRFEAYDENSLDHTAWVDDRLDFVNKPLSDIFDCLEHWYGVNILCNDIERASEIRLSMVIRQEPIEEIFDAIGAIADMSFFIDSRGDVKLSFLD